jgi:dihydropteroate synthase
MLRMVGNPTAVNPNWDLLQVLKKDKDLYKKISIVVERKDIIYKVSPNVETVFI